MPSKRLSRILGAAVPIAFLAAGPVTWRLFSGDLADSKSAEAEGGPTQAAPEPAGLAEATPLAGTRTEARAVGALAGAVSFSGTAVSPATLVEAWRVLDGDSPEFVRIVLGEDLAVEDSELFGGGHTVILRRLIDAGAILVPASAQIQRSELPLAISVSPQTQPSLLTYSLPEGGLVPSGVRVLSKSGALPPRPLRGVFPFHERATLERLAVVGAVDGDRTLLPLGFEGKTLVLTSPGHALGLCASPALEHSPRLALLEGGVELAVTGVVPSETALKALRSIEPGLTLAPVHLELGSRGEEFGPSWKLPEGPFRMEFVGLEPDAYSASLTFEPSKSPKAPGSVLASEQTEMLQPGTMADLRLVPAPVAAGVASASLTLIIEDPHELVPMALARPLELTLDRVDLPPERSRLQPSRRLRLALANSLEGQTRSFCSSPTPWTDLEPGAYEVHSSTLALAIPFVVSQGEHLEQRIILPAPAKARIEWIDATTGQPVPVDFIARWTPDDGQSSKGFESAYGSRFYSASMPPRVEGPSGWYEFQVLSKDYSVHKQRAFLQQGESVYTLVLERPPELLLAFPIDSPTDGGSRPLSWTVDGRIVAGPHAGTDIEFEPIDPSAPGTARFRVPFSGTYRLSISVSPGPGLLCVREAELKPGAIVEIPLPSPRGF